VAVPTLADVPGLPALPGADVPSLPSLPSLPGAPSLNTVPTLPATPDLSDVPGTSNLPGIDSVPGELNGFSGDLPLFGQLPITPSTQSLPEVPLATPSTLPGTGNLPALPVDGLPIGAGDPALPVSLPAVPQVGTLPMVSSSLLPGQPDLLPNQDVDTQSAPALPGLDSFGDELPGLGALPVFSAPLVASSLPTAGALPSIGADGLLPSSLLPADLPTSGLAGGTNLPSLSQLGNGTSGMQDLPTFGALPELPTLPSALTLPGMPALPSTPHLPGMQSIAVTPGATGSDLDLPNFENSVPNPTDILVGGAPVSSLGDLSGSPLSGVQAPGALSSVDAPALSASDSAAGTLRNLAGQGLDGVQLPSA
jgi:integrin beta 8